MKRRYFVIALASIPSIGAAQTLESLKSAVSDPLIAALKSKLGITDAQAKGGLGSVLKLAQERLAAGDFDKLAKFIPGAQKYIDMAKSLGAVTGPVKSAAGLNSALSRLGIKPEVAAKFVPTVLDAVGKVGGESAKNLLAGALKT